MSWQERRIVTFLSAVLAILFAVVLVLLGMRYKENRAKQELSGGEGALISADSPSDYTALTYENGSFSLSFALDENGNWVWTDDPAFPLDDATILGITARLSSWETQQVLTDSAAFADAGFDQPSATLTASTASGQTTLTFGRATTDGSSRYVRLNGDETTAYILDGTLYDLLQRPIYDMMALPKTPELTEDCLLSVSIQGPAGEDDPRSYHDPHSQRKRRRSHMAQRRRKRHRRPHRPGADGGLGGTDHYEMHGLPPL